VLGPAQRHTLGGEVTRAIRQAVLTGAYQPGDHLTEAEIAREMGVSHGPVREALRELEAEDLVIIERHRGAFVRAFTAQDVREIYSFRSLLETAMVHLTQARVQPADLDELQTLIDRMRMAAAARDTEAEIELDLEFHRRLCELSGHRRMYEAWLRLSSPIRLFLTMAIPTYLRPEDAAESHAPIVQALRAGDAVAATRYMEQAVGDIGEQIADAMGSATVAIPRRLDPTHREAAV
jgi:DNA-binding GntR family transcriptional regulator